MKKTLIDELDAFKMAQIAKLFNTYAQDRIISKKLFLKMRKENIAGLSLSDLSRKYSIKYNTIQDEFKRRGVTPYRKKHGVWVK